MLMLGVPVLLLLAGQLGALSGSMPADLGVTNGRLKPPSLTPNSVSSQAMLYPQHPQKEYAQIEPLRYEGDAGKAMAALAGVMEQAGCKPRPSGISGYLHAECSTRWLGFVDDAEFWWDEKSQMIQVRSASRLGRRDFGVNRDRVERIRQLFPH